MIRNVVVVSDLHCGCRLGLCPEEGIDLDDGGIYMPSKLQRIVWGYWREFWDRWVPEVTHGEPFSIVANGDILDGVHHNSTTQVSHNLGDQRRLALRVMRNLHTLCNGNLFMVRGTESHVGQSAVDEETLAREVGAIPNHAGQYARWDLWIEMSGRLVHFLHHISTSGSNAYEGTALSKELTEEWNEAARWGRPAPDVIVRSHRHRNYKLEVPTRNGMGYAVVTPGWQLKTPFTWRIAGGRLAEPQFGGVLIRMSDEGEFYVRAKVWSLERTEPETI